MEITIDIPSEELEQLHISIKHILIRRPGENQVIRRGFLMTSDKPITLPVFEEWVRSQSQTK